MSKRNFGEKIKLSSYEDMFGPDENETIASKEEKGEIREVPLSELHTFKNHNTGIATYIWVLSNKKEGTIREGKVQLINANGLYEKRRKALGNKRNDISEEQIAEITRTYGDFKESEISQIYDTTDFGYTKITVERPLLDEDGNPILKKGKPQPDSSLRDTENVPLKEDIQEYFDREVKPFAQDAWIDKKKSKIGYEIPFTRYFYKYEAPKPSDEIMAEIKELEKELSGSLEEVFD